jgi:DNA-binding CsgD family transcriptional regulator/PAS domain-containing protein
MYRHDRVLRLVRLIYDAALDPSRWHQFLETLIEMMRGHSADLWTFGPSSTMTRFASVRTDPAYHSAYDAHYAGLDPWMLAGRSRSMVRPAVVALGEALVSPSELRRTEFYEDFGRRFGIKGGVAAILGPDESLGALSAVQRSFGQFTPSECKLLAMLTPHLERALTMHRRLAAADSLHRATADILDALPVAALLVNRVARPLFMNRAARDLTDRRDGLHSARDGVTTNLSHETRALREMVTGCAATSAGHGLHAGGPLKVSRRAPQPPLHVLVAPVRMDTEVFGSTDHAAAIIFAHDPSARLDLESTLLRELYGLTPAEARIAAMLAQGRTVAEMCALLSVSAHTVRTHVKRLLQKTQTRTQSQLVRELLAGLARVVR